MFRSYDPEDLEDKNDYKFRTISLFLPQVGIFYCHRERRGDVELHGVTTLPHRSNGRVPEYLLRRNMVVSMLQVGRRYFQQVYSVIHDMESNSGLEHVEPMDGMDGQRVAYDIINISVDVPQQQCILLLRA